MKSRFGAVPGIVAAIFALMAPVFFPVRPAAAEYPRTEVSVEIPEVTLTRTDGIRVPLRKLLSDGKPVMVQFIFTTCTTICPVMSAVFATVREELGPGRKDLLSEKNATSEPDTNADASNNITKTARAIMTGVVIGCVVSDERSR